MSDLRRGVVSLLAAAVLVVAGLGLTVAVGGQSTSTAITTVPGTSRWAPPDQQFVEQARTRVVPGSDATLVVTAHGVCNLARDGRNLVELLDYAGRRHGLSTPDAVWLVGLAVRGQCPERASVLAGAP